jgi:hypothetical protein
MPPHDRLRQAGDRFVTDPATTRKIVGILSSGRGHRISGGTFYNQPINEVPAAYGLTIP